MSHLSRITLKLQRRTQDILEAQLLISDIQDLYRRGHQAVEDNFRLAYQQCERLVEKIDCEITMHRNYWQTITQKRMMAIAFLIL